MGACSAPSRAPSITSASGRRTAEQRSGMVIGELQNAEGIALGLIDDMLAV